jgi:hypothetical protein
MNENEPEERTLDLAGHSLSDDVVCVKCGNPPRRKLPAWATPGAIFALRGTVYRIVSSPCSTNEGTPGYSHFRDYVIAEPVKGDPWKFPEVPTPKAVVAEALGRLRALPRFFVPQLETVSRLVRPEVTQ